MTRDWFVDIQAQTMPTFVKQERSERGEKRGRKRGKKAPPSDDPVQRQIEKDHVSSIVKVSVDVDDVIVL